MCAFFWVLHQIFIYGGLNCKRIRVNICPKRNGSSIPPILHQDYWYQVRNEDFVKDLPLDDPAHTIPLVWHTDGVKIYKNHSYSSIVKKEHGSLANKMVLLLVRDALLVKNKTHDRIGEIVAYITRTLQTGRYPETDVDGKPFPLHSEQASRAGTLFASGWRSCFAGFKSDLEARAAVHKRTRNYMSNYICEHCPAGKFLSYRDFTSGAAWQDIRFSHEEFLQLNPHPSPVGLDCRAGLEEG